MMSGRASIDETLAFERVLSRLLDRLSPGTLFGEAVIGLLNPETTDARHRHPAEPDARRDPGRAAAASTRACC